MSSASVWPFRSGQPFFAHRKPPPRRNHTFHLENMSRQPDINIKFIYSDQPTLSLSLYVRCADERDRRAPAWSLFPLADMHSDGVLTKKLTNFKLACTPAGVHFFFAYFALQRNEVQCKFVCHTRFIKRKGEHFCYAFVYIFIAFYIKG